MTGITPVDALDGLISFALWEPRRHRHIPPGGIVNRASPETRELLSRLKSDDIKTVRKEWIWAGEEDDNRQRLRERLLEFDRKVLKL